MYHTQQRVYSPTHHCYRLSLTPAKIQASHGATRSRNDLRSQLARSDDEPVLFILEQQNTFLFSYSHRWVSRERWGNELLRWNINR